MAGNLSRPGMEWASRRLLRFLAPLLAALVLLSGCGEGNCNCYPMNLPVVRIPHVRSIHGLDKILVAAAENSYEFDGSGAILGLATYTAEDGSAHLLAALDNRIYTIALPDGRATAVPGSVCGAATLSLTPDGSRLACLGTPESQIGVGYGCDYLCFSKQIQIVTYAPGTQSTPSISQTISATGNSFSSPTWRPDGRALAVIESVPPDTPYEKTTSPNCTLALYAQPSPGMLTLVPALSLTVARFSFCYAVQTAWSPDGRTLAILTGQALLFVTPPAADVITKAASSGHVIRSNLTMMRKVTLGNAARAMAWTPNSRSVTVLGHNAGESMDEFIQYPLDAAKSPTPLFTLTSIIPSARTTYPVAGPITYSANGRMLIFAYGMRQAQIVPSQPPSGSAHAQSAPYPPNTPEAFRARVPLVALRPQMCICPDPPTGLYAYMLPDTTS